MTSNEAPPILEPALIIIFGITGDLSRRYLLPALYHLIKDDLLHNDTEIIGVTRQNITTDKLMEKVEVCVNEADGLCDPAALKKLKAHIDMQHLDLTAKKDYEKLKTHLDAIETKHGMCMNRLIYLSIPPQVYGSVIRLIGEANLNDGCQHNRAVSRLLVEKPFGYDLNSAENLIKETGRYFTEGQIFRIDHYVARETVQNILTFRFTNPLFASIWDSQHIKSIVITADEKIGIEGRVTFYEEMGALRDFIQSHLLQLLAIVTMDEPKTLSSNAIHSMKATLLNDIKPIQQDKVSSDTVRGQYHTYRKEVDNASSIVETFAATRLTIDNPRWKNTRVLLQTGKALDKKLTDICVTFFAPDNESHVNRLHFQIQPNEGIILELQAKRPGFDYQTEVVPMSFNYQTTFNDNGHPNAYERVLVDAARGDHTLFSTSEEILASWKILDNVEAVWTKNGNGLFSYANGSTLSTNPDAQVLKPVE